jgi:hypothetical protein
MRHAEVRRSWDANAAALEITIEGSIVRADGHTTPNYKNGFTHESAFDMRLPGEEDPQASCAVYLERAERNTMRSLRNACRRKLNWRNGAYALLLLSFSTAIALQAQTFTVLHSFDGTDVEIPSAGLVQATNGDLYGTTTGGGGAGPMAMARSSKSPRPARLPRCIASTARTGLAPSRGWSKP